MDLNMKQTNSRPKCAVSTCPNKSVNSCSACHSVYYCSGACQKADWITHRVHCTAWTIIEKPGLGRQVVASRPLKSGTLVLEERSLSYGPLIPHGHGHESSLPTCLTCCRIMNEDPGKRCGACGWPVCSQKCEKTPMHVELECGYFCSKGLRWPLPPMTLSLTRGLMILRICIVRTRQPDLWPEVVKLQSLPTRVPYDEGSMLSSAMEQVSYFQAHGLISPEDWLKIYVLISAHEFSHRVALPEKVTETAALFSNASHLSKSCIPNCIRSIAPAPNCIIQIRASTDIQKGDILTLPYEGVSPFIGTRLRQRALHFPCGCLRCSDPTECNSFLSTWICMQCLQPAVSPNDNGSYTCRNCGFAVSPESVVFIQTNKEDPLWQHISNMQITHEKMVVDLQEILQNQRESVLHSNHWIILEGEKKIVEYFGRLSAQLTEKDRKLYLDLLKHLFQVADLLTPGMSRERAQLQHCIARETLRKAEIDFSRGSIGRREMCELLNTSENLFKESLKFYGPDRSECYEATDNMSAMAGTIILERVKVNDLRLRLENSY